MAVSRLHDTQLFPDPRFFLFVIQKIACYKNHIKCGSMSASMKWRYLGHLRLLSKAVAVRAEVEINSQEEMANPQGMKLFAVERHGLPEDFVYCPAMCGVQSSSPLVFVPNWPIVWGPLHNSGRHKENICASGLRSSELYAQVARANCCTPYTPAHMDTSIARTGRNG